MGLGVQLVNSSVQNVHIPSSHNSPSILLPARAYLPGSFPFSHCKLSFLRSMDESDRLSAHLALALSLSELLKQHSTACDLLVSTFAAAVRSGRKATGEGVAQLLEPLSFLSKTVLHLNSCWLGEVASHHPTTLPTPHLIPLLAWVQVASGRTLLPPSTLTLSPTVCSSWQIVLPDALYVLCSTMTSYTSCSWVQSLTREPCVSSLLLQYASLFPLMCLGQKATTWQLQQWRSSAQVTFQLPQTCS